MIVKRATHAVTIVLSLEETKQLALSLKREGSPIGLALLGAKLDAALAGGADN